MMTTYEAWVAVGTGSCQKELRLQHVHEGVSDLREAPVAFSVSAIVLVGGGQLVITRLI